MYKVVLTGSAENVLKKVFRSDKRLYHRLIATMETLKESPYHGKALRGRLKGKYCVRVGMHRIIYEISKQKLIVYILIIGHRQQVYR